MKFRYYITNLYDGIVQGTDKEVVARELAQSEDFFIVDSETGEYLSNGNTCIEVKEFSA